MCVLDDLMTLAKRYPPIYVNINQSYVHKADVVQRETEKDLHYAQPQTTLG